MKKSSYSSMTPTELQSELDSLRATVHKALVNPTDGKNSATYRSARKNIARVLTALRAKQSIEQKGSTTVEK